MGAQTEGGKLGISAGDPMVIVSVRHTVNGLMQDQEDCDVDAILVITGFAHD